MRSRRALWIGSLAAIFLAAVLLWFRWTGKPSEAILAAHHPFMISKGEGVSRGLSGSSATSPANQPSLDAKRVTVLSRTRDGYLVWPGAAAASKLLDEPGESAREDIQAIHAMLSDYRSVFGETPFGGLNEEITRGLLGDNPKKIVFLTARKGLLSASGELLDRWGTPFFFHKLSSELIDLRSAGPDHKMFTADDIFEHSSGGPTL